MQEKIAYQAGPFTLSESRTERKIGYPERICPDDRVQPEVRHPAGRFIRKPESLKTKQQRCLATALPCHERENMIQSPHDHRKYA
jgi:hypothetical protein